MIVMPALTAFAALGVGMIALLRKRGQRLYDKYNTFTKEHLDRSFVLEDYPVKPEFRVVHPVKAAKLIRIAVSSKSGERIARVNTLDATMMGFVKMYTLLIRPHDSFNLPVFSADIIFMGKRRVFILELIDPVDVPADHKNAYYEEMKSLGARLEGFEESGTNSEWAGAYLAECSIHIKADEKDDDILFEVYRSYLEGYLKMVTEAPELPGEETETLGVGLERYVDDLLSKGGPAVDVFKKLLGPEKQAEYVKSILFGM